MKGPTAFKSSEVVCPKGDYFELDLHDLMELLRPYWESIFRLMVPDVQCAVGLSGTLTGIVRLGVGAID